MTKFLAAFVVSFALVSVGCAKPKTEFVPFTAVASTSGFEANTTYPGKAAFKSIADSQLNTTVALHLSIENHFSCEAVVAPVNPLFAECEYAGARYQIYVDVQPDEKTKGYVANIALLDERGRPLGDFGPVVFEESAAELQK